MKNQLCVILMSCVTMLAGPTIAGTVTSGDTSYEVTASYQASGNNTALGYAKTKAFPERRGATEINRRHKAKATIFTGRRIEAKACARGDQVEATVNGSVAQNSAAEAQINTPNMASAAQGSRANFSAETSGAHRAYADGRAKTLGRSYAKSCYRETRHSAQGRARAITASTSCVRARGENTSMRVEGGGEVMHQSLASKENGFASTFGEATYHYDRNAAFGSGLARTSGASRINTRYGAVASHAQSLSVSTGGHAFTDGVSHISSN